MKNAAKTTCPVCRSQVEDTLPDYPAYLYCRHCQTAWLKVFPQAGYRGEYYKGKSNTAAKFFTPLTRLFYTLRRGYIRKKPDLWIDVGAGDGGFLAAVEAKHRIGVEISQTGREMIKSRGLEVMTDKQFLNAKSKSAEVISFWHVLEHTKNPREFLVSAKNNLKKEGKIIVGVPNLNSWEFRTFKTSWFHFAPQYHYLHFSSGSIVRLLKECGFKIEKVDFWSAEYNLAGILQSLINRTSGSQDVLHKLIKREQDLSSLSAADKLWCLFWLTLGLLPVFILWGSNALYKQSGSIVITASLKNERKNS